MIVKRDVSRARTTQDLERKFNFGQTFAEMFGLANDAQKAAEQAKEAAAGIDETMTQQEIFNRLTNGGEEQGIYLKDGKVYINGSYMGIGVIASSDGTVQIDLANNTVTINTVEDDSPGKIVLSDSGIYGFGWDSVAQKFIRTLIVMPGRRDANGSTSTVINSFESAAGLRLAAGAAGSMIDIGNPGTSVRLRGDGVTILDKAVSWKDNGDGTYTLIGT